MPVTFKGSPVTVLRPATPDDPDFVESSEQVLVRLNDGAECLVAKSDLKDSDAEEEDTGESVLGFPLPSMSKVVTKRKHKPKRRRG